MSRNLKRDRHKSVKMVNKYYLSEQCKLKPQRNTSTYPSLAKIRKTK